MLRNERTFNAMTLVSKRGSESIALIVNAFVIFAVREKTNRFSMFRSFHPHVVVPDLVREAMTGGEIKLRHSFIYASSLQDTPPC